MYMQRSDGSQVELDPNSAIGQQVTAQIQQQHTALPLVGCWPHFCLPMPLPDDPDAKACVSYEPGPDCPL
jgi:hypothetical protein